MSLTTWLEAGWLQRHKTSSQEIRDLWLIVDRDLADATSGSISADWQYGIAYNATLKLCTILLYAEGFKPAKVERSGFNRTIRTSQKAQPAER